MFRSARSLCAVSLTLAAALPISAQDYQAEFSRQWGLGMIGLDPEMAQKWNGAGVLIGVTDSGLYTGVFMHPEFAGRLNGLSYDGFTDGPLDEDTNSHGTHVAGIIAASRDGNGMMGVASGATIVPLRILHGPLMKMDPLSAPLRYSLANGVRIFNASWGVPSFYDTEVTIDAGYNIIAQDYFTPDQMRTRYAHEIALYREVVDADGVMVFANGNLGNQYPLSIQAAMPYYSADLARGWLAVTSVGPTGQIASYAQTCSVAAMWCVAAPGGDIGMAGLPPGTGDGGILSTYPWLVPQVPGSYFTGDGLYASYHGTSMAAPHVSGALAIAKQLYPNASYQQLRTLVLNTATDIGAAGIDPIYGWGLLNVGNLVGTASPNAGTLYAQQAWGRAAALDQIMDGVAARSITTDANRPYGWWITPFASFGNAAGATAGQASDAGSTGITGGVEFAVAPDVSLGLFAGGSAGSLRAADGNSATDGGLHGGAVLSFDNKALFADLSIGASRFWGSTNRVAAPGLAGTVLGAGGFGAGASFVDTAFWGGAEVGYRFDMEVVEVAPYAFGRVVNQQLGAFGEVSTSALALSGGAMGLTTGEVGVGVQLLSSPLLLNQLTITPSLDLAYGRRLGDFDRPVELLGNALTASVPVGRDVLHVDAALDVSKPNSPFNVRLGYGGSLSSGAHSHALRVSLSGIF